VLSRPSHDVIYFCRANVGFKVLEGETRPIGSRRGIAGPLGAGSLLAFRRDHFPYWPNQLYRIIDDESAAELLQIFAFEVSDGPGDGACKRILEDHLVWSPSQPLSPLLSASSSRASTEHSAEKRIRRGNGRVRIATIDVSRAMQHAELFWMPYLLWLFGADVDPRHVYPTEWVFVHEIPSEAITLNTLQGFRTGGITVLPFSKYIMLIVLGVVERLLPQAIPLRFSEVNYGLDSDSSGDDDDYYFSNDEDTDTSGEFDNFHLF
jgi:hypothetical protein